MKLHRIPNPSVFPVQAYWYKKIKQATGQEETGEGAVLNKIFIKWIDEAY